MKFEAFGKIAEPQQTMWVGLMMQMVVLSFAVLALN